MGLYLYYFLNRDGSIPLFDSAEAESTDEALRLGAKLLARAPERSAVEVWDSGHRIEVLRRNVLEV